MADPSRPLRKAENRDRGRDIYSRGVRYTERLSEEPERIHVGLSGQSSCPPSCGSYERL